MDVEAKSFRHAFCWEEKIIKDNYFFQNKISIELFEPKIEFPDLQGPSKHRISYQECLFLIPGSKYTNNPIKRRLSWILAARSKTTRATAWQTAKMDSAQKSTLEKHIRQL